MWRAWAVLAVLALTLFGLALLVADRLARSMTRPVAELAVTAERLGRGDLDRPGRARRPGRGARGRRRR